MNRDEQDWINALNATGNLANTLAKTEAQGLQIDAYLKEKADKEKQAAVANWATTGISRGLDPNQLNKFESVPTNQAAWDSNYKDMNRGLKPGTSGYVAPENFSMSSDVKAGSAEIQTGVNEAMKRAVETHKADFEMKKTKVEPMIRKLPMDKLNTLNFEEFGDMAEAARSVAVEDMKTRADASQYKMISDENIAKGIEQHWNGWSSSLGLANDAIAKGNKVAAMAKVATAINVHNGDSRKFEVNPETMTSGKFFIIQEGKKSYDDKEYQVEDLLKEMNGYTPEQFNEHNWKTAKASQIFNSDTTKNSKVFFDPNNGKYLTAQAQIHPVTGAMTWLVYDKGKLIHSGDIKPILEAGYVGADSKKEIDANIRSGLAIEGDRERIKTEKLRRSLINEQIKKALNSKGTEEKNVQLIRDRRRQATNAFAQDAWSSGIDIKVDPETGDVMIDKVLTQAQADYVNKLASIHGFKAALRKEKDGIDNGWFRFDTDGYRFGGVSENKNQRAEGLSTVVPNTQSGKVMSKGEFDATITGQENKQPPVKTGKGLIERAYNSVVPADGFADTVVKKGFGPIPGQAKELAGVVYEKGLKPIPGQVKGAAKAVAKPFAAPYSAAAKLTKLKVLKNQLSHAESDKEKKEIKAEIEALSKSK